MFANLNKPAGGSLFGGNTTSNASPFGGNATSNTSPFGQTQTNQQQPAQGGLFGQSQPNQQQSSSGLFGQSQANTQQQQQQQQQQPQQHQALGMSLGQAQQNPLYQSVWEQGRLMGNYRGNITDQMKTVSEKWDPASPNCGFKYYFYNKVEDVHVPFYQPGPNDNPKEWEEALQNKPAAGLMPVLASGFAAVAERLKAQRIAIGSFNARLHEINSCLDAILSKHDLQWSVRASNARRRHEAQRKRSLALARKVQVLRNRGYAMSGDEDELRIKLEAMEKSILDPAVNARLEELWSRLILLRDQSQHLQAEIAKRGLGETEGLPEEVEAKAKKIVEDYEKQLQHLKKEVELIQKDLEEWQKDHPTRSK